MAKLIVQGWHTECSCGYGKGGWAAAAAGKDVPILTPDSVKCPGCGEYFDRRVDSYGRPRYQRPLEKD